MLDDTEQLGGYVLPECSFTAPTGKQFKCWAAGSTGGNQYAVGEEFNVTENVTFYAVWVDIPVSTTVTIWMHTGDIIDYYTSAESTGLNILVFKGLLVPDVEVKGFRNTQGKLLITIDTETGRITVAAGVTAQDAISYELTSEERAAVLNDYGLDIAKVKLNFVSNTPPVSLSRIDAAITTPVAGAKPSFTATATANGYTFSNVRWWELDGDREYVADVGANDTFKPNTWYYLWIDATPSEGYEFTATPGAYINGEKGGSTAKGAGSKVREIYKTYKTGAANQTLFSIAVTTPPTKTEYTVGNNFDPAGMVVTATYTDKTTAAVTGYTVSPSGKLGESDKTVTVSYTEGSVTKTATTPITVKAPTKVLESIAITKAPTKTEYTVGNNFDPAGMVVTATYADKTTAAVTGYTVSPSGKLGESDKTVTVSYTEGSVTKTATQAITVAKGTVSTMKFTDVPSSAYYSNAVSWAVDKGITSGTSGTTFSPNADCTRAQIVTFLWRTAGSPAPKNSVMTFTDVPDSAYYRDAVLWAVEQKITSGTSATTFSPSSACTRSQAVTFLYRFANSPKPGGKASFSDVPDGSYYADAVTWAKEQNITSGTSATTFSPNSTCTRAQIVTFLYRLLGE